MGVPKVVRVGAISALILFCVFLGSTVRRASLHHSAEMHDARSFISIVENEATAELLELETAAKKEEEFVEKIIQLHREIGRDPLLTEPPAPLPPAPPLAAPVAPLAVPATVPAATVAVPPAPPPTPDYQHAAVPATPYSDYPEQPPLLPAALPGTDGCSAEIGEDRPGNDLGKKSHHASDPAGCCDLCGRTAGCEAWTFQRHGGSCWLKSYNGPTVPNDLCVSGVRRPTDSPGEKPPEALPPPHVQDSDSIIDASDNVQRDDGVATPASAVGRAAATLGTSTVVLIIAHNRPAYLTRCLAGLVKHHPGAGLLPIIVSEDREGDAKGRDVTAAIDSAAEKLRSKGVPAVEHVLFPDGGRGASGYARLARHYKWAITTAFASSARVKRVIVLEEDLEIAPDFFEMFGGE